jgi:hypothetical protein
MGFFGHKCKIVRGDEMLTSERLGYDTVKQADMLYWRCKEHGYLHAPNRDYATVNRGLESYTVCVACLTESKDASLAQTGQIEPVPTDEVESEFIA